MKVSIELKASCGHILMRAFDADDAGPDPKCFASGYGVSIKEAACDLVSRYKEMQDATIAALDECGLIQFADADKPAQVMS